MTFTPEQIALARRYEPVLHLDDAQFLPSDPKRYLENAALWATRGAGKKVDDWGQEAAGEWPKTALRQVRQVAGLKEEATGVRAWIGDLETVVGSEGFLALGGWFESESLALNGDDPYRFADLRAVLDRYQQAPLADSRPWYYAEVFTAAQLGTLADDLPADVTPAMFTQIMGTFTNPTLVLYHLFFPGHVEGLPGCDLFGDGPAFGTFAGDWGCVAVLADDSGPRFLGATQRNPGTRDRSDDATRLGMVLTPWQGVSTPDGHGTHPELTVVSGTHSMFADVGNADVRTLKPFTSEQPDPGVVSCGDAEKVESVDSSTPHISYVPPDAITVLCKLLLIGFGWGWLGFELGSAPFGLADPGVDPPTEQPPTPSNAGVKIAPVGVAADATRVWPTSGSGATNGYLDLDGRRYPFLMDRGEQRYWPSPDAQGFHGRWGPAVADDPRGRRSGMRVPPFAKMFLSALARV